MGERTVSGDTGDAGRRLPGLDAALGDTLPGQSDSQQVVENAATVPPPAAAAAVDPELAELERGSTLDHFVILEQLGVGGMGVVLAAYDPDLDRKVAIKLMRPGDIAGSSESTARARLLREAQALAKLTHPNVTRVYEVGSFRDRISVVMEYVHGQTLTAWLAASQRSWREVVPVFVQAARGLIAAHDAGLVHRDFKPDNVLVGDDGRVLVTDFGLVSSAAHEVDELDGDPTVNVTASSPLSVTLTCGGALLGTPAYMAPEQLHRKRAEPRSDQFSFCVALYEALYGERPFAGKTYFELRDNIQSGTLRPIPRDTDVPAWLRAIALRGLSADPGNRFPSMHALVQQLSRDPNQRWRRLGVAIGVGGLATLAVVGLLRGGSAGEAPRPCSGADQHLAGVWDPQVKQAIGKAFAATERPHADETFGRVADALDSRAAAWITARTDACEDTQVRGEQSAQLMDLRIACLDRRADETRALTTLFADQADDKLVDRASAAVSSLTPVSACDDFEALTAAKPLPDDPGLRASVATLRHQLDDLAALASAGRYKQAIEQGTPLAKRARELGYPPARAEALLALAGLQARGGDPATGESLLYEALESAGLAQDHRRVAQSYIELIHLIGTRQAKPKDALPLRRAAETAVAQAGNDDVMRASLFTSLGLAHAADGDYKAAQKLHQQALTMLERNFGGPHPRLAMTLGNLGNALAEQGEYAASREHYERALTMQERLLGPHHPDIGFSLNNLANVLEYQGESERAARLFQRAIEIWQDALPPNHPLTATALNNLGNAHVSLGDHATARADYQRALDMLKATFGDDHMAVGAVLGNLGEVYVELEQYPTALQTCLDARAITTATVGDKHPDLAYSLTCIGRAHLGLGAVDKARAPLERALALREANKGDPLELAETRFALARCLWKSGGERRRAIELAKLARAAYTEATADKRSEIAEISAALDRWQR